MLQENHGAEAAAPSRLPGGHVYLPTTAADWFSCARGGAPPEAEAAARSGSEVARWERSGGSGVGGGSSARLEPPLGADPPRRASGQCLPPPSVLSAGSAARALLAALRGRNGFAAPRAVRGNGPGRASPLAPGFAARPSPPRLPAVPPGTGSAARPGKVGPPRAPPEACGAVNLRGSWGPSALPSTPVRAGTATPGTPYGAPVLPVAPGFSWSPTAQRETFGPGLVYSSSAFNACSILNGGTCKKFTSFLYNKLIIE